MMTSAESLFFQSRIAFITEIVSSISFREIRIERIIYGLNDNEDFQYNLLIFSDTNKYFNKTCLYLFT